MSTGMTPITLTADQLDWLADLIADKLAARSVGDVIDATELAQRLGRSRDFVYAHAVALGAVRLGDGPRPRLAFRWPHVLDQLAAVETRSGRVESPVRPRKQRPRATTPSELLPIRGRP